MTFVLLGEFSISGNGLETYVRQHHFGRMWARDKMKIDFHSELVGFDNGAYSCFRNGRPFDEAKFLKRLDHAMRLTGPGHKRVVVAACPDIVEGGEQSLEFSLRWCERLPNEYPWFLVVQDGMDKHMVSQHMSQFSGLFLGGSDQFKTTANMWCQLSHAAGKMFHWGRCRSVNNVREALAIGADSIDSVRPVRAWVSGERHRAKAWLNVARGRDKQRSLF